MTTRAGYFGKTSAVAVTSTAAHFQVAGATDARKSYFVTSDKTIHLSRGDAGANVDATTDDLRIPSDTPVIICAFVGDFISYILGTGETDGTIWFTEVDH